MGFFCYYEVYALIHVRPYNQPDASARTHTDTPLSKWRSQYHNLNKLKMVNLKPMREFWFSLNFLPLAPIQNDIGFFINEPNRLTHTLRYVQSFMCTIGCICLSSILYAFLFHSMYVMRKRGQQHRKTEKNKHKN